MQPPTTATGSSQIKQHSTGGRQRESKLKDDGRQENWPGQIAATQAYLYIAGNTEVEGRELSVEVEKG